MNGSTRALGCCCSPRRTNANELRVNAYYANDSASGFPLLSFPCEGAGRIAQGGFSIGNLKYNKALFDSTIKVFHREAREGLGIKQCK